MKLREEDFFHGVAFKLKHEKGKRPRAWWRIFQVKNTTKQNKQTKKTPAITKRFLSGKYPEVFQELVEGQHKGEIGKRWGWRGK